MAAMSELETGGSSPSETEEEGRRSRATLKQRSRALNWSRGEYAELRARVRASRRSGGEGEEEDERRANTTWREVV